MAVKPGCFLYLRMCWYLLIRAMHFKKVNTDMSAKVRFSVENLRDSIGSLLLNS